MPVGNDPTADPSRNTTSGSGPEEEPRMIGEFNDSADDLWTLFGNKVKSHGDIQIKTVKDKMDSALIFVRSNSVCAYCGICLDNIWPCRLVYIPLSSRVF